jgi:hypothetical protein
VKSFEQFAGYNDWIQNLTGVTANFLPMLGVVPQLGRLFAHEEDRPEGPPVIILSDHLPRNHFHAGPAIVGKSVALNASCRRSSASCPAVSAFLISPSKPDVYAAHGAIREIMPYYNSFRVILQTAAAPHRRGHRNPLLILLACVAAVLFIARAVSTATKPPSAERSALRDCASFASSSSKVSFSHPSPLPSDSSSLSSSPRSSAKPEHSTRHNQHHEFPSYCSSPSAN